MDLQGQDIKRLFFAGAHNLNSYRDHINELNVFPVPDGDTGTNMTMTVISACKELMKVTDETVRAVSEAIPSGALRGARGNSGVILSQLFRGFFRSVQDKKSITVADFAEAIKKASETAYKAVMKPKEGTILTVAAGLSEAASEKSNEKDLGAFLSYVIEKGNEALNRTPDLLPVLKEAGVVDSGGQGLITFLEGVYDAYMGKEVSLTVPTMGESKGTVVNIDSSHIETADIHFQYCTEFIIKGKKEFSETDTNPLLSYLKAIGDCVICIADGKIIKVHVHTNDPGLAMQKALAIGELSDIKVDNLKEEQEEKQFREARNRAMNEKTADSKYNEKTAEDVGFIAVCAGDGLQELFSELGCGYVISGGQTMNPSTEDFLYAIDQVNAKTVFVFPNNGNVIMAANQASVLAKNRHIIVVPTTTVVEGVSAILHYIPGESDETNLNAMKEAIEGITTIEVTYAVRETTIDHVHVHKDDYMALSGKTILSCHKKLEKAVKEGISRAVQDDTGLITLYYGDSVTEEEAEDLADSIRKSMKRAQVEVVPGGQPVYSYLISLEA